MYTFEASQSHKWYNTGTTNGPALLAIARTTTHRLEVDMFPQYTASDVARFWSKVDTSGDCWLWTATTNHRYGIARFAGQSISAHRLSYVLHFGPIPEGLLVCHRCDVPRCVRPDHLFLGTSADNTHDMIAKGRSARGQRNGAYTRPDRVIRGDQHYARQHPERLVRGDRHWARANPEQVRRGEQNINAKLTWSSVDLIRQRHRTGVTIAALAREYGVSESSIRSAVRGETWKTPPPQLTDEDQQED